MARGDDDLAKTTNLAVTRQLCVKVADSEMGPPIVIEAGFADPENDPVPLPDQLVKL